MTHDPSWYDQQYNARSGIPDHMAILQGWAERSARTRARGPCVLDVPYTAQGADDPAERLDIFLPEAPPPGGAPVLVHLHGGYWRALDKKDQSFVADAYVPAGALVVVPNYALCPAVSIAHIVLQMVQALAWVWRHAAAYRGDARRLVVSGHSAGGQLAAMMLACDWPRVAPDLPPDLVRTAVAVSGLFDLEPLRHAPFLAEDIRLDAAEARRLSPVHLPAPQGRQLLAFVGGDESAEFHRQGQALRAAWGDDVAPVCEPVPGCHHLSVMQAMIDPRTRLNQAVRGALGLPTTA
jgi:arylformamidase